MKFYYLLSVLILAPILINAQSVSTANNLSLDNMASRGDYRMQNAFMSLVNRIDNNATIDERNVNGSKYFNDAFLLGKISINNKSSKDLYALRYNAYSDLIEVQKENEVETLIKAINVSCTIGGKLYVYQKYLSKNKGNLGYLKVLNKGQNATLFKQESVIYKEARVAQTSHQSSFSAKFVQFENYYFLEKDNKDSVAMPLTKKSVLNAFDNDSKIKSYIKKEKISFKSENDLINLFSYINIQ